MSDRELYQGLSFCGDLPVRRPWLLRYHAQGMRPQMNRYQDFPI
jgi:hypothetical protein